MTGITSSESGEVERRGREDRERRERGKGEEKGRKVEKRRSKNIYMKPEQNWPSINIRQ